MYFLETDGLPGGDDFRDITDVFEEAARDMEPGSLVFMDGFTLQDAMSAFEIGEPRLDTGVTLDEERQLSFNPMASLLPEELCWVLDRSLACEMEWHAGNTLSQTVFTILYVHHLGDINPDIIPHGSIPGEDGSRPFGLVSVVLRSFMFALLKSCDLAWREMSKDKTYDGEDWQGEKCDVSLLEGATVQYILQMLDEASFWVQNSTYAASSWRDAIYARIFLRKTILELLGTPIHKDPAKFDNLINQAREHLRIIRNHQPRSPSPGSPAALSFDPHIARRLNSFLPLRALELPAQEDAWNALDAWLNGWHELCLLSNTSSVCTWETVGCLRAWNAEPRERIPYLRSLTQSIFYDGVLVLNKFSPSWLVDRFFIETLGVSKAKFVRSVKERWAVPGSPPISDIERRIVKVSLAHIRAQWFNAPRRRRHFMKSILDWHILHHTFVDLICNLSPPEIPDSDVVAYLPDVILHQRLSIVREVIFSGFQLELYARDEKSFAYWYAAQVIEAHLSCIDNLLNVIPEATPAYRELSHQRTFLTALQVMSIAMFSVLMKHMTFPWEHMKLSFLRRYKWAFRPEFDQVDLPVVAPPRFYDFPPACADMIQNDYYSPSDSFKHAQHILVHLIHSHPSGWAGRWEDDRIRFVRSILEACTTLCAVPSSTKDLLGFDLSILKWNPAVNPWFPHIQCEQI